MVEALADAFENELDYSPGSPYNPRQVKERAVTHNRGLFRKALERAFAEGKDVVGRQCDEQGGHFFEKEDDDGE